MVSDSTYSPLERVTTTTPGRKRCLLLVALLGAALIAGTCLLYILLKPRTHLLMLSSPNDSRQYRATQLDNSLRLSLVSDNKTAMRAIAINVAAGYFADTLDEFPAGIAHFLEHLLFMGTDKYPGENYADEVTSGAGGHISAYTDSDVTNYWAYVPANLRVVTDVMAQFFVAPRITKSAIAREMRAVESEYNQGLNSDVWARHQLMRSSSRPDSCFYG